MKAKYFSQIVRLFLFVFILSGVAIFFNACEENEPGLSTTTTTTTTEGESTATFNPSVTYGSVTDQDGWVYKTVTIGSQTWFAENLRTTKYNDGTEIFHITDNDDWANSQTGAYSNYNNVAHADSIATYGRLYNWYAVNTDKLCPSGWHVPTDEEWNTLTTYLGGVVGAASKLKETGTNHWAFPNSDATNESGFTAVGAGYRGNFGFFIDRSLIEFWWSATENSPTHAWHRHMTHHTGSVFRTQVGKQLGYSIRCIQD